VRIKKALRRHFNAVGVFTERDCIEVQFQDFLFAVEELEPARDKNFF